MPSNSVYILIEQPIFLWQTEEELRCALLENTHFSSWEGNSTNTNPRECLGLDKKQKWLFFFFSFFGHKPKNKSEWNNINIYGLCQIYSSWTWKLNMTNNASDTTNFTICQSVRLWLVQHYFYENYYWYYFYWIPIRTSHLCGIFCELLNYDQMMCWCCRAGNQGIQD